MGGGEEKGRNAGNCRMDRGTIVLSPKALSPATKQEDNIENLRSKN